MRKKYDLLAEQETQSQKETREEREALKTGVKAFDEFLKWVADTSQQLGRRVDQGRTNAIESKDLAEVMANGAHLRFRLACKQFDWLSNNLKASLFESKEPPTGEGFATTRRFLNLARAEIKTCWTALEEQQQALIIYPLGERPDLTARMAFDLALVANQSRAFHGVAWLGGLDHAIKVQALPGIDKPKLDHATAGLKEPTRRASEALALLNEHFSSGKKSIRWGHHLFAGSPDLVEHIKCLRDNSSAAWALMGQIERDLKKALPGSDAVSDIGSLPIDEHVQFARDMDDSFKMFSTACANVAYVLEKLTAPSGGPADPQTALGSKVEQTLRGKAPSRGGATSASVSKAPSLDAQRSSTTTAKRPPPGAAKTQKDTKQAVKPDVVATTTTEKQASSATEKVNALIDKLRSARKHLGVYDYSHIESILNGMCTEVNNVRAELDRLIDRAGESEYAAPLRDQLRRLNSEVEISYSERFKFDAYKLRREPIAAQWDNLLQAGEIHVGHAKPLLGPGDLFEMRLKPKRCSNGVKPASAYAHFHLKQPAKLIEQHNIDRVHLKSEAQRARGRRYLELMHEQGHHYAKIHYSVFKPDSDFCTALLLASQDSADDALRVPG